MDMRIVIMALLVISLLVPGCTELMKQEEEKEAPTAKFIFLDLRNGSAEYHTVEVNASGKNSTSTMVEAIRAYENSRSDSGNNSDAMPPDPPPD